MEYGFYFFSQWLSYLELIAMLTGVAGVWLTLKQNVACFPVGMINVLLYAWLFFTPSVRLYADATLQCTYFLLLAYGWHAWTVSGHKDKKILITKTSKALWLRSLLVTLPVFLISSLFFDLFTNADLPWLDSALTTISLLAQWMIARKKLENWLLWILVDTVYIPVYLYKGLPLTAFLYLIFLIMAINGWMNWKKSLINTADA
ncbi:MAG TPA: nicotinamide riboside transporter PnuC [Bacteroidia bacterium]|nr:nicotinamide riboside transporter PnuC [Bacteroidia bacterium]